MNRRYHPKSRRRKATHQRVVRGYRAKGKDTFSYSQGWSVRAMQVDVVVIGAGPAGISAALTVASRGAKVAIVDEQPHIGGRLPGQLYPRRDGTWWIGREVVEQLQEDVHQASVEVYTETSVWGIFPGWTVHLYSASRNVPDVIDTRCVIVCTGASQKPTPVSGWTLPGVLGIGAVQMFTNAYGVRPGQRALIIGPDILGLSVAVELSLAGVDIAGVVLAVDDDKQASEQPAVVMRRLGALSSWAPRGVMRSMARYLRNPLVAYGAAALYPDRGVKIGDIPLMLRRGALSINGKGRVESVTLGHIGMNGEVRADRPETISVDTVVLSGGLSPLIELLAALGCETVSVPSLGGQVPLYGPWAETTMEGVFVAGTASGVEGAQVAMAQGELAGMGAARYLGLLKGSSDEQDQRRQVMQQRIEHVRADADIQFISDVKQGRKEMVELWTHWAEHRNARL